MQGVWSLCEIGVVGEAKGSKHKENVIESSFARNQGVPWALQFICTCCCNCVLIADAGNLSIATSTAIPTTTQGNTAGESSSLN